MAKETQTYTGYTNYETWAVCLWLDNEEYSSAWLHGVADSEGSIYAKARRVEQAATNAMPDLGATMWADLLGAALGNVNWREVIESHMQRL